MTACIGALTLTGPSIILSADMRVTHGPSPVGPNDQAGKQYPLPPYNCAAVIGGSISECHEFIGRLVQHCESFATKERHPYREEMMEAIDESRWQVYRPKINQALKADLGISLDDWHEKFIPPAKFDLAAEAFGMQVIRNTPLNVSTIVGGFIGENTMFFCAKGMRQIQSESSPGVHAIGSGSIHAMQKLNERGQNLAYGLARTIFHVHEAMVSAQQETTVGSPTNYLVVIKDRPLLQIRPDNSLLKGWLSHFHDRNSAPLDSEESNLAIQAEMLPAQMPPYSRPLPMIDVIRFDSDL